MSPARRKAIVGALAMTYALLVVLGPALLGARSGVAVMLGAFVVGFAWLWLLVAPWALEGRARGGRRP